MDNSKGSIILKALSSSADQERIIAYLEKRAKSIPPEKIPSLLQNLPVVLSRNVAKATGTVVIRQLEHLGAEAFFIAVQGGGNTGPAKSALPSVPAEAVSGPPSPQPDRVHQELAPHDGNHRKKGSSRYLLQINKEIWIIFSMLGIAWLLNSTIASQYLLLGFYTLPAVMSAYYFGRRQAILTAFASILLVGVVSHLNPEWFERFNLAGLGGDNPWYHIVSWGCILLVTVSAMGTLHERNKTGRLELRQTYQGLLLILRHLISQDEQTESRCFRVSIYATRIAACMGLAKDAIDDIRSAALLHDIGTLAISRDMLHRAARLNREEPFTIDNKRPDEDMPDPLRGPLGRILPMLLGDHETFQDSETLPESRAAISTGARILAVADAYDTMTSGEPCRKALSPDEAKEMITNGTGRVFDPEVVNAFVKAFDQREMELPSIIL